MQTCNKRFENAATRFILISFFIALNTSAINISSCEKLKQKYEETLKIGLQLH